MMILDAIQKFMIAVLMLLFCLGWLDIVGVEYTWWNLIAYLGE
jgi:hypothetical protein